jgi:RHS repeat-associated protein
LRRALRGCRLRRGGTARGGVDQVTGLVLVVHEDSGAREYDPEIGRWVERDPIGFAGGLNTFDYVDDSPVDHVARSGLLSDFDLKFGVQGASRAEGRAGFDEAAPGVALVGAIGGVAAIAVVVAPPPVKAAVVGAITRAFWGAQTAAFETALVEAGGGGERGRGLREGGRHRGGGAARSRDPTFSEWSSDEGWARADQTPQHRWAVGKYTSNAERSPRRQCSGARGTGADHDKWDTNVEVHDRLRRCHRRQASEWTRRAVLG